MLADDILDIIKHHSMNRPRSLQVEIGPSDLSQECDHCLAAKLYGWEKKPDPAWLAYVGTAIHAQLAEAFNGREGFWSEWPTTVGRVGDHGVSGTADLIHLPSSTVVDFKTVGKAKLDAVRRGDIPGNYRTQVHLYAKGLQVDNVALLFLPRNEISLDAAVWWQEPYDPQVAASALARGNMIHDMLSNLTPAAFARQKGCYDCARYPDAPGPTTGSLADLIGV